MKQILQDLKNGETLVAEVAAPQVKPGHLLIQTSCSLISAGTERMLLEFGRAGYLSKARQQPEKVKQVLDKIRTDGLLPTIEAVSARLDQPLPMGYCNVGRVIEVGQGVTGFAVGDRVVSNGHHAEVVCVPKNLCALIPDNVSDDRAVFTVIASIAMQGIRLLQPTLGESMAVFGLGLVGLIAGQLLQAGGTRVIGFDFDSSRVALACKLGLTAIDLSSGIDPIRAGRNYTRGRGLDGVLVTAATTSHELMHQAAQMSRQRGRIILTGVTGLNLNRADFYEKELTFQVSCSYGPGRYDSAYEEGGHDYPFGLVRWTEQRNFEAVLDLMAAGQLQVDDLISIRVPLGQAQQAYDALAQKNAIGILLEYPHRDNGAGPQTPLTSRTINHLPPGKERGRPVIGVIGAGQFTQLKILPALKKSPARLKWVASAGGVSGAHAARKFGFENSTTAYREILADPEVNGVFITTRHNAHARMTIEALRAGKSVFVEKPLCLNPDELGQIIAVYEEVVSTGENQPLLMVGFNRRFSPLTVLLRQKLAGRQSPLAISFSCNAGAIPADHWVHDPEIGGGRIIGEACHFIDLLQFIAESPVTAVSAIKQNPKLEQDLEDTVTITLSFADGSVGHINYFSNGTKDYPKERLEVFSRGRIFCLDNFKSLQGYGVKGFSRKRLWRQDKGHRAGFDAFLEAISRGKESPIPFSSTINVTEASFAVVEAMRSAQIIRLQPAVGINF